MFTTSIPRTLATVGLTVLSLVSISAHGAAAQRTFVKSTGIDNLTCSLATPCRSFAAAIANTLAGGEVIVLDSAGYGPVTITQSVSIIAPPGVYAGISVPSGAGAGIDVLGAGIIVVLQGLTINGTGGNRGIFFEQGAELHIINCSVANMAGSGIQGVAPGGTLYVSDTAVRSSAFFGVLLSGNVTGIIERTRLENNGSPGVYATNGASLSLKESLVANNSNGGLSGAAAAGTTTRVAIDDTLIVDNAFGGASINSTDPGSAVTLDIIRSTSTRNTTLAGVGASATAPATAVATVTASLLSENGAYGMFITDGGVVLANGNTLSRNPSGGLVAFGTGIIHTRSNNSGEQAGAISGTVTAVPGF